MKALLTVLAILLATLTPHEAFCQERPLYNPYERPKNGPPLTNVVNKLKLPALWTKLRNPKHHPAARMPDFKLTDGEVLDIMAYLKSTAERPVPPIQWPAWAAKASEDMDDRESAAVFKLVDRGKSVWGSARCTICHTASGPRGRLIGGFVDLRVGGIDLQIGSNRLQRDWLYRWVNEPKSYFPDTLMPRFRFLDAELRALVEYLLRDDAFLQPLEDKPKSPERWEALDEPQRVPRGRQLIEMSRCVVCHEIKGVPQVLRLAERRPPPPGTFDFLAYDLRCLSCHSIEGRGGTYAPDLTGAGSRLHEAWIAQFVRSPDMIRPLSQQMPKFNLAADEARVVASYVSTSRRDAKIPAEIAGGPVSSEDIQRGRESFKARGCVSCHSVGEGAGGVVGPALDSVGDRLKSGYVWYHLKDPHAVNPYSAEPDYGLPDEEARAVAAYLSTRKTK